MKALNATGLLKVFEPHLAKKLDVPALSKLDKGRQLIEGAGQNVDSFGPFLYTLVKKLSSGERDNLRTRAGLKASEAAVWLGIENRAKSLQKALTGKQATLNSGLYRLLEAQDHAVALYLLAFAPLKQVRDRIKNYFTQLAPLVRSISAQEIEAAAGVKRESSKFAAAREAYITARLDKKPPRATPAEKK